MSTEPARERSHRHRSPSHRHRSPHRHHHKKHARSASPSAVAAAPALLPFNSPTLSKHDYPKLEAIFDSYLSIQKNLTLSDLSHRESRGRFKSFISHYNRGDLARGWYERVIEALVGAPASIPTADAEVADAPKKRRKVEQAEESSSSDSDVGPVLPGTERRRRDRAGPRVPGKEELEMQKELQDEDAADARADLRYERRLDRRAQKEQLDELVPRAEPGTRERQLEKKREVNDKMRAFRDKSPVEEVDEGTVMGAGESESFAHKKAALVRKKNDRELRREQLLQARIAEREERVTAVREKEEKTMAMLKQLASRFQ